jgi:hypothetical protein
MRARIQHVQDTGQPLRPAYNEIKSRLAWLAAAIGVFGIGNAVMFAWLIRHMHS